MGSWCPVDCLASFGLTVPSGQFQRKNDSYFNVFSPPSGTYNRERFSMVTTFPHRNESEGQIAVLHVEDDPEFRDLTTTCLHQEGEEFSIDAAPNPDDALNRLAEKTYDCIVSDYDMPGRNGIEFLETVREEYPDLPFILYTGKGSEEVASEAISSGVTDYLQKTGDISQYTVLANRIQNAVERYRSMNALEASEKRFSLFVEQSPIGVLEYNDSMEIVGLNPAGEEILGYTEDELQGESWETLVTSASYDNVDEVTSNLLDAEGGFHSIDENLRKDGETIVCEWHNRVVTDESGTVVAIFSLFHDVTERRERRQQLETLLDNLPGFVYRAEHEPGWPIEFVKGSVLDVTGHTAQEIQEDVHRLEEIIYPDDREDVRAEVERQLADSDRFDLTYRICPPDGGVRWVWERGSVVESPITGAEMLEGFISDISEQKHRERELRHTSARLKALFDQSPDMINVHDNEGNITDPNPRLCETTGYDDAELTGMKVWELDGELTPEDAFALWEGMDRGDRRRIESSYRCRDGSTVPVEAHVRRLDLNGEDRFVVISRDITERKAHEQERRQQRTVFSTVIDNLPVGILVEDESRNVLATNERFHEIFEFDVSAEELVGADCETMSEEAKELFADPEAFITSIESHLASRTRVTREELVLADGRVLERDYVPYELPGGAANLWVYYDVTENRERQQFLNGLFESSLDGIGVKEVVTDDHGNPVDYVYKRVNRRFEELTGLDADEVVGRRATEVIDGIEETPFVETFGNVALEGTTARFEQYSEPLDRHYEISAFSPSHGQVITIFSDITDRKEREEVLRRERDRLDEFASVLSHDLRNPLNVAELRLDLARQECDTDHLDDVAGSLDRIEILIEDLLSLAREGERVSDVESVAISTLTEECWGNVDTATATLDIESECKVEADRSRLRQLLENLIRNAVEHGSTSPASQTQQDAEEGGETVSVTVGALDEGFFVEDNGPGIPTDEWESIFEMGYSSHPSGTGFGLSIVQEIASAHGWSVSVTDSSDGGARFEITDVDSV